MDIPSDKPTPFPNLGLTVQPVSPEDTKSKQESTTSFTMSIKKTPADKADEKFGNHLKSHSWYLLKCYWTFYS